MPETRRRKPTKSNKDNQIRIRVTDAQKRTLTDAAARLGLGVSSWLLSIGLREAGKAEGGGG